MKRRGGFTLIEIVVAMSLIAVLTALSVGFLRDLYDNYQVAQSAEVILGLVRDAQSKAMAVEGAKAYGVEIFAKGLGESVPVQAKTITYIAGGTNSLTVDASTTKNISIPVTSITLNREDIAFCEDAANTYCAFVDPLHSKEFTRADQNTSFVVNFSSPYGTPEYFLRNSAASDGTQNYCESNRPETDVVVNSAATFCAWKKNDNYLESYSIFHMGPKPMDTAIAGQMKTNGFYMQNGGHIEIRIAYNSAVRVITVEGSGEAYIE